MPVVGERREGLLGEKGEEGGTADAGVWLLAVGERSPLEELRRGCVRSRWMYRLKSASEAMRSGSPPGEGVVAVGEVGAVRDAWGGMSK